MTRTSNWPDIPYAPWAETCAALHLWSQIVGKYRLAHTYWVNHSWQATLYVTPRGLTTGPVHDPSGMALQVTLDLCDHRVRVEATGRPDAGFALEAMSVADFHARLRDAVTSQGGTWKVHGSPNEIPDPVPFSEDRAERPYDADAVARFHRSLLRIVPVFERFRTSFLGKVSPVHLFWGSFDLAVTRFSGRRGPIHPGGFPNLPDDVTREAYDHEVSSAGFWPGGNGADEPMFYSYAYPAPPGFAEAATLPDGARFDAELGEFVMPYAAVRAAPDPDEALLSFLRATYAAAADAGGWERERLDCAEAARCVPRPVHPPRPEHLPRHAGGLLGPGQTPLSES